MPGGLSKTGVVYTIKDDDAPPTPAPAEIENSKQGKINELRSGKEIVSVFDEEGWNFNQLESQYITKVTSADNINETKYYYYSLRKDFTAAYIIRGEFNFLKSNVTVKDKIANLLPNTTVLQVEKSTTAGGRRSRNQRKSKNQRKSRKQRKSRRSRR